MLKLSVKRDQAEQVETALLNSGALSCTYEDATDTPILEPAPGTAPLWPVVIVSGIFAQGSDKDIVTKMVTDALQLVDDVQITAELFPDSDWERSWMDEFKPVEITTELWIVPSFCEAPDASAINISLDPGLAFGSGTHPTTHLCLQWLAELDLKNKTVIDYGCGSGILAVAAALCGATAVYAFDIEAQALLATRDNAKRNGVADKITICHNDKDLPENIDIVVANILLAPLLELRSRFMQLLAEGGRFGASGLLSEQLPALAEAYALELRHSESEIRDQWAMYTAVKTGCVAAEPST